MQLKSASAVFSIVLLLYSAGYALPTGIYASGGPTNAVNNSVDSRFANYDFIDGALVRIAWKEIETSPGVYDWSRLDEQFNRANQYGLKISLGVVNGFSAPSWLQSQGTQMFSYLFRGSPTSMPVPWDQNYLNRWTSFVQALGDRYQNKPELSMVHITTSSSNGFEMQIPFSPVDITNWNSAPYGYTVQKHVNAYKQVIDAFNSAFPDTPLDLEVHPVLGDNSVAQQTVSYGNQVIGDRFGVFAAWWSQNNADGIYNPMYQLLKDQAIDTFASVQLVTNATNDNASFGAGGIQTAIDRAYADGIRYFEPWDTDLLNSNYTAMFTNLHSQLLPEPAAGTLLLIAATGILGARKIKSTNRSIAHP